MVDERISIGMCANSLDMNGISTVIINYCQHMDLQKFKITLLVGSPVAEKYHAICEHLVIDIVELPSRKQSGMSYYRALNRSLKQIKPDIFHIHANSATVTPELFLAWKSGIKVRIAHSHNTTCTNKKLHKMLYPFFSMLYTDAFACGIQAGKWLFKEKKFSVVTNGFHTEKFRYDEEKRRKLRKKLLCENRFIIGHVGRFNNQKNQPFLLDIFRKVAEKNDNAVLLLVGIGPDFEKTKVLVDRHPYKERIILYGETDDPVSMYMAMDVFCLPSKHEGLPVVLLEAQIAGLPCVVSDKVTQEVDFGDICWLSLESCPEKWADCILNTADIDRISYYQTHIDKIKQYNIEENAKQLEQLYKKCEMERK
ncbi:MAG: glycosyltransferase [Clostridiales bacterium]|nr:glycosyltransferase [Clostridiales bacterium]